MQSSGSIDTKDATYLFEGLLNEKALVVLNNKTENLIYQFNEWNANSQQWIRHFAVVKFLAVRYNAEDIYARASAVERVSNMVNLLAGMDIAKATLATPMIMEMATSPFDPMRNEESLLFYVALTEPIATMVEKCSNLFVREGGIPMREDQMSSTENVIFLNLFLNSVFMSGLEDVGGKFFIDGDGKRVKA